MAKEITLREFVNRYRFRREFSGHVGPEWELVFMQDGHVLFGADTFVPQIVRAVDPRLGTVVNEFDNGSIELSLPPQLSSDELVARLFALKNTAQEALSRIDPSVTLVGHEVGPDVPFQVYPHDERYLSAQRNMQEKGLQDVLDAAGRVHSFQLSFGVQSIAHGIDVLNRATDFALNLVREAKLVSPVRMSLYERIFPAWTRQPQFFRTMRDYYDWLSSISAPGQPQNCATDQSFDWGPLARFLPDGRVELRVIGAGILDEEAMLRIVTRARNAIQPRRPSGPTVVVPLSAP